MAKKINIKVVANGKGGVGKSIQSKYILPTILQDQYSEINVYEIDNNNNKGNFKSDFVNHSIFRIDEKNEAIFDVSFNEDEQDILSIIDCGGGDDLQPVIDSLYKNQIENIDFYIPTLDDDETFDNIKSTIDIIKEKYPKSKITLILNKVIDPSANIEKAKEQFINIFGSEKYGYESKIEDLAIDSIALVPHTPLLFLIKNHYRISMTDLFISGADMISNLSKNRKIWKKEANEKNDRQHYYKKMEAVEFASDLIDFIDVVKRTLRG